MKKIWKWLFIAFIFRLILLPFAHHGDVENHVIWGTWGREYGLGGFYDFLNFFNYARPNQPPLTILLYTGVAYLHETLFSIFWWVNVNFPIFPSKLMTWFELYGLLTLLKLPAAVADIGLGYLIYRVAEKIDEKKAIIACFLFLFNPLVLYNSSLWGQTDSILVLLGISAALSLYYKRIYLFAFLLALTLLFKATLILYIPIFLVILYKQKYNFIELAKALILFFTTIFIIAKPFAVGEVFSWVLNTYTKKISGGDLHLLSANAFNMWNLVFGNTQIKDNISIFGISAYLVGITITLILLSFVCLWLFKQKQINLTHLLYALTFTSFISFLFLTRMHERYLYPIFIPLVLLAIKDKTIRIIYILLSFLHFLNLYFAWSFPEINILVSVLKLDIVTRLLSLSILIIFIYLTWYVVTQKNKKS